MAILSDIDIRKALACGSIHISDLKDEHIGSCSIDLRLGNQFRVFKHAEVTHVDPREGLDEGIMDLVEKKDSDAFIIHPGEFVLGSTVEFVKIPTHLVGRLDGRSSWGRLGIIIHSTAGSVQPGYEGQLTLEIANISKVPVKLWPGSRICQITFERLTSPCQVSYKQRRSSKYKGQEGPSLSKIKMDD